MFNRYLFSDLVNNWILEIKLFEYNVVFLKFLTKQKGKVSKRHKHLLEGKMNGWGERAATLRLLSICAVDGKFYSEHEGVPKHSQDTFAH